MSKRATEQVAERLPQKVLNSMDVKRARKLVANLASTRQELEQLVKEALAANERELAFDINDAIDNRFPSVSASVGSHPKAQTGHFVAYHSKARMGYSLILGRRDVIFLSKKDRAKLEAAIGGKAWIITGATGGDRKIHYHGAGFFVPHCVKAAPPGSEFRWQISGPLTKFKPRVLLDDLPWFHVLRAKQGSFAFGINPIIQPEIVKELEALAKKHTCPGQFRS
jgi:hypothetical protein